MRDMHVVRRQSSAPTMSQWHKVFQCPICWPDLFADADDDIDEATQSMLILFVGVMFGVHIAQGGVAKVANMVAPMSLRNYRSRHSPRGSSTQS
jgi:hypothetical protein